MTIAAVVATSAWGALLVVAALLPLGPGSGLPVPDWLAHGVGYGVQAGLIRGMLHFRGTVGHAATWSVGGALALGAVTELLQGMHPVRSAEVADLLADGIGAVAIVLLVEISLVAARRRRWGLER